MKLIIDLPDDAYEQVKETWTIYTQNYVVVSLYRAVKTAEPFEERPTGKWVPVSERLPKQGNQSYLVTVDYGNGVVCSCQRFFFNEDIGWNDDCVIAWQPLPEPFQKGE